MNLFPRALLLSEKRKKLLKNFRTANLRNSVSRTTGLAVTVMFLAISLNSLLCNAATAMHIR